MAPLTETDAERHLAAHALHPAFPGFVGLAVVLPPAPGPAGTMRLRHGFRTTLADHVVVSGPPSPGLEVAVQRMAEDLRATHSDAAVRVSLEAGTDDDGPTGIRRRWAVAHAIAPVLVAAFANSPHAGGRSTRQPIVPAPRAMDPCLAWARQVLDAPVSPATPATFRSWIGRGTGRPPTIADLDRHQRAWRPPVAARGHLEIDVTDPLPDDGWIAAAAVVATLLDDAKAADEALAATAALWATPYVWERALRDALIDPAIAAAARSLFLAAYAGLARRGTPRPICNAVADYLERYVGRGRCPADDRLVTRTKESRA